MPDEFVPVDTSEISSYFLMVRPFIYQFALKYTENNRAVLGKFTEAAELEKYLDRQGLLQQFTGFMASGQLRTAQAAADNDGLENGDNANDYGSNAGSAVIKPDPEGLKISGRVIHTQIKAYIARDILGNKGFYPIREHIDTTLKYAIKFLEN